MSCVNDSLFPAGVRAAAPEGLGTGSHTLMESGRSACESARFFVGEEHICHRRSQSIMGIFTPTAQRSRAAAVTPELLEELGVRAVLLDVDNTIATYTSHEPAPGAVEWARGLCDAGFRVVIVSNNYKKRVAPFAARFGLGYICFAMKPLPFGYIKAARQLKMKHRECAIIGDQIFTDVIGANLCGMKSVLLEPIEPEEGWTFKLRRYFERGLRQKFTERKDVIK